MFDHNLTILGLPFLFSLQHHKLIFLNVLRNITLYQVIHTLTSDIWEYTLPSRHDKWQELSLVQGWSWLFSMKYLCFPTPDSIIQVLSFCCLQTFINGMFILSKWLLWTCLSLTLFLPFVSFVICSNTLFLMNMRRFTMYLSTHWFTFLFKYLYWKTPWNASQNIVIGICTKWNLIPITPLRLFR